MIAAGAEEGDVSLIPGTYICVMKRAPLCLGERLRRNEEMGRRMTRGSHNLFVPAISTENYRRSFTFRGTWEWNKLPKDLKMVVSSYFQKGIKKRFSAALFCRGCLFIYFTSLKFFDLFKFLFLLCSRPTMSHGGGKGGDPPSWTFSHLLVT